MKIFCNLNRSSGMILPINTMLSILVMLVVMLTADHPAGSMLLAAADRTETSSESRQCTFDETVGRCSIISQAGSQRRLNPQIRYSFVSKQKIAHVLSHPAKLFSSGRCTTSDSGCIALSSVILRI